MGFPTPTAHTSDRCSERACVSTEPVGKEDAMSEQQATGTSDPTYDIISVVYHALQGAETIQK